MPPHPTSDGKAANTLQIVTGHNSSTLKLCFMKDNFTNLHSSIFPFVFKLRVLFIDFLAPHYNTRSHYAWDQTPAWLTTTSGERIQLALPTCQGSRVPKWLCHGHLPNFAIKRGESCFRIMALSLSLGLFSLPRIGPQPPIITNQCHNLFVTSGFASLAPYCFTWGLNYFALTVGIWTQDLQRPPDVCIRRCRPPGPIFQSWLFGWGCKLLNNRIQ